MIRGNADRSDPTPADKSVKMTIVECDKITGPCEGISYPPFQQALASRFEKTELRG